MTVWKYIDTSAAAVAAMRDYPSMQEIMDKIPDEYRENHSKMFSLRTPSNDGMPHVHNPQAGENALVRSIDTLDAIRARYREASEYLAWFEPAWDVLSDEQQYILREFYMGDNQKSGATYRLMAELNQSQATVDRARRKALSRLASLLFGWYGGCEVGVM